MQILIIEDEKRLADALGQIMQEARYQADIVYDGRDGLAYASSGDYDVIVLDVMLPGIDGFAICKQVRAEKDIPILMVTARREDIDKIRASASLPLVARNVKIDGKLYLDGGISDAIPLEKSILDGNRKNILVMTKEVGFVRKPASASQLGLIKLRYLKYPKVYELMADRHIRYNECLDYIDRQEKNGQAFVIRPHKKSDVGRIEKDKDKLIALYEEGYQEAENCYEDLLAYLEK